LSFVGELLSPPRRGIAKRSYFRRLAVDLGTSLFQGALRLVFLADQAGRMIDAIGRTLARLYATRRRLLEWTPARQATRALDLTLSGFLRRMSSAVALGAGAALLLAVLRPSSLPQAFLLLAAWAVSPAVARWVSLPPPAREAEPLAEDDRRLLRSVARKTWRFFETFPGPEDNFLPPDNFQQDPEPVIAHRTSPTHIGLGLLSTGCAPDPGWIGVEEMLDRREAGLDTIGRAERYRGHLYNWYETTTLKPLEPRYVSTVDSGNLAGDLIAVKHACLER